MKKTGPATSFRFLAPAFALLPAALLPGERPTPLQDLGGAIMRIGVWWIHRR
jgi:drug/metabolite transporter (DMT)-like permease